MEEEKLKPEEMAEKLGIDPEKIDFTINEDELQKVSGAGQECGEIGYGSPDCTKTGPPSGCSEIGIMGPPFCAKAGV